MNGFQPGIHQRELFNVLIKELGSPEADTDEQDSEGDAFNIPALRTLLAEDRPGNQTLAIGVLSNWGHTVDVTGNGVEAVNASADDCCDLILMDIQMPEMDGLPATREIRARESGTSTHIPIIAMMGDREECLDCGMDGYVSKLFHKEELLDVLLPLFGGTTD